MNGHRTITRLAGKLTPDDNVEVAINTRIMPSLKAPKNRTECSRLLKQRPHFCWTLLPVKNGGHVLTFILAKKNNKYLCTSFSSPTPKIDVELGVPCPQLEYASQR